MEINMEEIFPYKIIPYGKHIQLDLKALKWSEKSFSERSGISLKTVKEILESKAVITDEIAEKLHLTLGPSKELFLGIYRRYIELKESGLYDKNGFKKELKKKAVHKI